MAENKKWHQKDKKDRQEEAIRRAERTQKVANELGDKLRKQLYNDFSMPKSKTETKED